MAKRIIYDFDAALAHLRDASATLSRVALSALSGATKENVKAFAQTWSALTDERRERVAEIFVALAEENFEHDFNALFRHMLNDPSAHVRVAAIEGLWEDQDPALVKAFVGFLRSDADPRVRAAAADALGRFLLLAEYERLSETYRVMAYEALLATVQSGWEESTVLCRSVEALGFSSQPMVREVIHAAYEDADVNMRASALAAMGHTADAYWNQTVEQALEEADPLLRFNAARAAGELEDRNAVPRLIALLSDSDREVQAAAVTALGQIATKPARRALHQAAESDDEVLSELASETLRELDFSANADLLLLDVDLADELDEELTDENEEES